jgi:hypothetical protein
LVHHALGEQQRRVPVRLSLLQASSTGDAAYSLKGYIWSHFMLHQIHVIALQIASPPMTGIRYPLLHACCPAPILRVRLGMNSLNPSTLCCCYIVCILYLQPAEADGIHGSDLAGADGASEHWAQHGQQCGQEVNTEHGLVEGFACSRVNRALHPVAARDGCWQCHWRAIWS